MLSEIGKHLDSRKTNFTVPLATREEMTKTLAIGILLSLAFYLPSCVFIYITNLCTACDCIFIHWIRDI